MDPEAVNVLHAPGRRAHWSRANEKGVFPGVSTPLNWSIWGEVGERGVRRGAYALGLLDETELSIPEQSDERMWSIFYGRPASNVDAWRMLYERGAAGDGGAAQQRQVFGAAPARDPSAPASHTETERRRATIEARRPVALREVPVRLREARAELEAWWQQVTRHDPPKNRHEGERVFAEALERFERADPDHIVVSLLATEAVTALSGLTEAIDRPELANALMVGYPEMEEFRTTVALWDLSRGRIATEAFLASHGFHGPDEGEIASRSWRERPAPVLALAERYRALPAGDDPRRRESEAVARRRALEAELREAVGADARGALDQALEQAALFLPLREAGRATLTIALDAMRAGARAIGLERAARGELDSAEEVFLMTKAELLDWPGDARARIAERRALRECYEGFELPETWTGVPERLPRQEAGRDAEDAPRPVALGFGDRIQGLGASAGVHEGRARVVVDPSRLAEDFEPGDVLVANATDPSWAPFFLVAGAVVIDTGSNISHAAVVAREMGIPAVVGAGDASQRIATGQALRVDGDRGTVEVIS